MSRVLLGSVTETVVRTAPCPVLTVRRTRPCIPAATKGRVVRSPRGRAAADDRRAAERAARFADSPCSPRSSASRARVRAEPHRALAFDDAPLPIGSSRRLAAVRRRADGAAARAARRRARARGRHRLGLRGGDLRRLASESRDRAHRRARRDAAARLAGSGSRTCTCTKATARSAGRRRALRRDRGRGRGAARRRRRASRSSRSAAGSSRPSATTTTSTRCGSCARRRRYEERESGPCDSFRSSVPKAGRRRSAESRSSSQEFGSGGVA